MHMFWLVLDGAGSQMQPDEIGCCSNSTGADRGDAFSAAAIARRRPHRIPWVSTCVAGAGKPPHAARPPRKLHGVLSAPDRLDFHVPCLDVLDCILCGRPMLHACSVDY
jgi:hypothetical protein